MWGGHSNSEYPERTFLPAQGMYVYIVTWQVVEKVAIDVIQELVSCLETPKKSQQIALQVWFL